MYNTPISRLDAVSNNTQSIINALNSHKIALHQVRPDSSRFIGYAEAMESGKFEYKGMNIYKEADTGTEIGKIWYKKDFDNPVTGKKEEWLVVYTNDDDDLSRGLVNSNLQKAASLNTTAAQNIHDYLAENVRGDDVIDPRDVDMIVMDIMGKPWCNEPEHKVRQQVENWIYGDEGPKNAQSSQINDEVIFAYLSMMDKNYRQQNMPVSKVMLAKDVGNKFNLDPELSMEIVDAYVDEVTPNSRDAQYGRDLDEENDAFNHEQFGSLKKMTADIAYEKAKAFVNEHKNEYSNSELIQILYEEFGISRIDAQKLLQELGVEYYKQSSVVQANNLLSTEDKDGNTIMVGATVFDSATGRKGEVESVGGKSRNDGIGPMQGVGDMVEVSFEGGAIETVPANRLSVIGSAKMSSKLKLEQPIKIFKTPELWETDFINLQPGDKVKVKKLEDTNYNNEQYKVGKIKYKGDTYYVSEEDYHKLENLKKEAATSGGPGAPKTPKPEDIPIAPGIKNKTITLNEGGAGGTAKVDIEFTDPQQGLDFYQNKVTPGTQPATPAAQPAASASAPVPSTGPAPNVGGPNAMSSLRRKSTLSVQTLPMLFEQKYPPKIIPQELKILWSKVHDALRAYANELNSEGIDDVPEDFPDSWYQYTIPVNVDNLSSLRGFFEDVVSYISDKLGMNLFANYECQIMRVSRQGKEIIPIIKETCDNVNFKYSFVNEDGSRFLLPWKSDYKIGTVFMRPDTSTIAKVGGYQVLHYSRPSDLSSLLVSKVNRPNPIPGGIGDKLMPDQVDPEQYQIGLNVEKEHSPDTTVREDITLDHLAEDPEYYTRHHLTQSTLNTTADKAQKYISKKIEKLMNEGYEQDQAAAIAYSKARKKGYDVPEKSSSLKLSHVVKEDGGYFVTNKSETKKLNKKPKSKADATKMLQAIEINKHKGSLTYSDFSVPEHSEQRFESGELYPKDSPVGSPAWVRYTIEHIKYKNKDRVSVMDELYEKAKEQGVDADVHELEGWYNNYQQSEHFLLSSLTLLSADISDEIPPMGWSNSDSKLPKPEGAGSALPPDKDLQDKPSDVESGNVLYDSNQDKGPQYQVTMDPGDKSIKVKYLDSDANNALENALGNPPNFNKNMTPTPPPQQQGQQPPPAAPPAPGGQQGQNFNQQSVPVSF